MNPRRLHRLTSSSIDFGWVLWDDSGISRVLAAETAVRGPTVGWQGCATEVAAVDFVGATRAGAPPSSGALSRDLGASYVRRAGPAARLLEHVAREETPRSRKVAGEAGGHSMRSCRCDDPSPATS